MGNPDRKQSQVAQVRELARQMKQARKNGDNKRASKLEFTIHIINATMQSYGQNTAENTT